MSLIDDAVLLKMAEAEILSEAKKAAARYAVIGVSGWKKCSKPNKTFLANTLLQAVASNRILARKKELLAGKKHERKLLRRAASDKGANFIYKKPAKTREKLELKKSHNKCSKKETVPSENKILKTVKRTSSNAKKVKLKKS